MHEAPQEDLQARDEDPPGPEEDRRQRHGEDRQGGLLNAIANTDFSCSSGLVVDRRPGIVSIRNPRTLMMPSKDIFAGGISDPRNPAVSRMFSYIGFGERNGSGVPRMNALCTANGIPKPVFIESNWPATVTVRINVPATVDDIGPYW